MEIFTDVHLISGITGNQYLLRDPDGLTLIDAGIPGSAWKVLAYLRRLHYSPRDLKRILITHADYDHVGGLAALKQASGARVYANAVEARAIATGGFSRSLRTVNSFLRWLFNLAERLGTTSPVLVDETLVEGQILPIQNGLHIVDSSGHTPGHVSFFAPAAGILFTGDSILSVKNRLIGSHGAVTWDQARADRSVRKQAALNARIVCPGHGSVVMDAIGKFPLSVGRFAVSPARN
ncbi:MAG: MBL fold metallo-hydrolase [Anaerolineales bacterium]|jgi:glyoxylase-like metal-dependent hydrolase (beta-lactamase superfamily II)